MEVLLVIISFGLGMLMELGIISYRERREFDAKMQAFGEDLDRNVQAPHYRHPTPDEEKALTEWLTEVINFAEPPKRGRGRPAGSKNKVKATK